MTDRADAVDPSHTGAGVVFPMIDGRRSTSATGRAVIAEAVASLDPAGAAEILAVSSWRSGYGQAYRRLTVLECTRRHGAAIAAAAGLASVHERFRFDTGQAEVALAEGLTGGPEPGAAPRVPKTVTILGRRAWSPPEFSVPRAGRRLSGGDLDRLLDAWLRAGTTEPSFATAIRAVMGAPEWLDLRDLTVVVLGAAAEMGPLVSLVRWGAHVVALDRPGEPVWRRLIEIVRDSPGRMSVPVDSELRDGASDDAVAAAAGLDVVTRTPEVLAWLSRLQGPFVLGNYVYADGADHVRASVAIDALTAALLPARADVGLAFLATPTDVFAVPADAVEESRRRYRRHALLHGIGRTGSGGRLFQPNYDAVSAMRPDGAGIGFNDSLVLQQGPNYALAKRIQRWRAHHEAAAGRQVSINVAPATRTRSVMRNRALAAAYAGAHRFGVEIFEPATSNTVMAALLVHDLRTYSAAGPVVDPATLLEQGANHGGLWRNAYAPRSVLGMAALLGVAQRARRG